MTPADHRRRMDDTTPPQLMNLNCEEPSIHQCKESSKRQPKSMFKHQVWLWRRVIDYTDFFQMEASTLGRGCPTED